jgi:ribosomal protein L37AE/L43A
VHDSITAKARSLYCPFCEVYELEPFGHSSLRCASCGNVLTGTLLETLRQIIELPDAVGHHACECGHPEMRRLPDEVYWCPACGSEFFPHRSGLSLFRRVGLHRGDQTRAASGTAFNNLTSAEMSSKKL